MSGLTFNQNLKLDIYGVWSEYWKDYYEKHSNMFKNIVVSGPLRKKDKFKKSTGKKILLLIEPLLDITEIEKFSLYINDCADDIVIKARSDFRHAHIERYIKIMPNLKRCRIDTGNIDTLLKDNEFGFFIATHSTAIQDCVHYGLNPIILYTETWGNYLNLDENFICQDEEDIKLCISEDYIYNEKLENLANKLSSTGDGSAWVVNELKSI